MGSLPIKDKILLKRTDFLQKVPLFAGLGEEDLKILARDFHSRKYRKKEVIFHQGDDSRVLYVVMKGKVRIFSISPAGNETSIHRTGQQHDVMGSDPACRERLLFIVGESGKIRFAVYDSCRGSGCAG